MAAMTMPPHPASPAAYNHSRPLMVPSPLNMHSPGAPAPAPLTATDASAENLRWWSKVFCLISPCTLFCNCLYIPCLHWLSRASAGAEDAPNDAGRLKWLRKMTLLTFLFALVLAVSGGVAVGRSAHAVAHHGKHHACGFRDREMCTECVDFVAKNVTDWDPRHHKGRGRHLVRKLEIGEDNADVAPADPRDGGNKKGDGKKGKGKKSPCKGKGKHGKGKDGKGKDGKGKDGKGKDGKGKDGKGKDGKGKDGKGKDGKGKDGKGKDGKGKDGKGKGDDGGDHDREVDSVMDDDRYDHVEEKYDCGDEDVPIDSSDGASSPVLSSNTLAAAERMERRYYSTDDHWLPEDDSDWDYAYATDYDPPHGKHHGKGKQHVAWPKGSRQACVAGDGPLNVPHKGKGGEEQHRRGLFGGPRPAVARSSVAPPSRVLQLSAITVPVRAIDPDDDVVPVVTTTTTTTTTWLAPCHKELLDGGGDEDDDDDDSSDTEGDGVEDEVDQATCPFYGGWGEDVVAERLRHNHHSRLPELVFHCRGHSEDDCEEICDCLGGRIMGPPLWLKILVLVVSSLLTLTTVFFALPKLFRHQKALKRQLQGAGQHQGVNNGAGDIVLVNGIAMTRAQQANYVNYANYHPAANHAQETAFHGREMQNMASAPYAVHYSGAPYPLYGSYPLTPQGAGGMYVAMGSPAPTPTYHGKTGVAQGLVSSNSKKVAPEDDDGAVLGMVVGEPAPSAPSLYPVLPVVQQGQIVMVGDSAEQMSRSASE